MSTLTITKKSNLVWLHEPSDKPKFIIGKFTFHIDGDFFQIVEIGQSKRNKYRYSNITIVDEVNSDTFSSFANITELSEKLAELGYLGFDTSYSTGVVSVNGFTGVVLLTGNNFNVTNPHTSSSSSLNQALEDVYNYAGGGGGSQDIDQTLANGDVALDKSMTLDSTPDDSYDILKSQHLAGVSIHTTKAVGSSVTYQSFASGDSLSFTDGAENATIKPTIDGSGNVVSSSVKLPPTTGDETGATREWTQPLLDDKADLVGGLVPSSQLPAYVDDVLEYANLASFPVTGETAKIYMALDTNKTYRWSGSTYVALDEGVALGETSSTAYRGDRGKTAYDHSQVTGNPHGTTAAQVGAYTTTEVDNLLGTKEIKRNGIVSSAEKTLTNTTSAQAIYDTDLNAEANCAYEIFGSADFTGLAASSSTLSFSLLGTATIDSFNITVFANKAANNQTQNMSTVTSNGTQITSPSAATTGRLLFFGTVRVSGAGTVKPSVAFSSANASMKVSANAKFSFNKIGSNTVTTF